MFYVRMKMATNILTEWKDMATFPAPSDYPSGFIAWAELWKDGKPVGREPNEPASWSSRHAVCSVFDKTKDGAERRLLEHKLIAERSVLAQFDA